MVEEAGVVGIEKACLNRLRESRLKSETRSTLIHILSRCYEDPNASRIFLLAPTRPGGGSGGEGEEVSDGGVMKVGAVEDVLNEEVKDDEKTMGISGVVKVGVVEDVLNEEVKDDKKTMEFSSVVKVGVVEDVLNEEVKDDEKPMELTVDEFENRIKDINLNVDAMEELFEGNVIDKEVLQEVEDSLLETVGLENEAAENGTIDNAFSNVVEVGFAEGGAVRDGIGDGRCFAPQEKRLDGPDDVLECGDALRTNGNDEIEEGEIGNVDASVPSYVSVEDNVDTLQNNEICADRPIDTKQRELPGEDSCSEFSSSVLVGIVDKSNRNNHQASSDPCVETGAVNLTSDAKINASVPSVANDVLGCPIDRRSQVFYGDISGEATPPVQGTHKKDADHTKKRKRGGNSKEKKKIKKRKKRAETDKKLGVKRMKLPPPLKPNVIKVCEHYLKGRCIKGGDCPFSHDAIPLTKSKACIHFARNNCMKGDACPYDHELWKYPCDNYASKGSCIRGSSCLFSHEIQAEKGSQGASIAEKVSIHITPIPGTALKSHVDSAAKLSVNTPVRVPKGLSFLSLGKPGSDQLIRPELSKLPQKVDLTGSNHSNHNVPGVVKTLDVTSIPFDTPVRSYNVPYLESQSDHSINKKNSVPRAFSSEKRVDLTNPLDQALQGLNSLVSRKVPVNCFTNESRPRLPAKEHNLPVSRLSMHQSLGLSVDKEKSHLEVVDRQGQTPKSKSQVVADMCEGATQARESGVYCFSSKSSTVTPIQKLITTIPKDQKSDKIFSIQDRGRQWFYGNPFATSAEKFKYPPSVNYPSSQGTAVNKAMPPTGQKALLSTSTLASKFESETKRSNFGSAGFTPLQTKPEIASSSKRSFNCEPVKASAILDFIFGSGSKTK